MPWLEATPMEQRERFIRDHAAGLYTMTELCARHTISRKTGQGREQVEQTVRQLVTATNV